MTKLIYLIDSYCKNYTAKVVSVETNGKLTQVVLDATIFYPQGGGQLSDKGYIKSKNGSLEVTHVRMKNDEVIHEGKLTGNIKIGDKVGLEIDWELRYDHMRWHSAGHLVHEITKELVPSLVPVRGEHGKHAYIEYEGTLNPKLTDTIEKRVNMLVAAEKPLMTEMVTLEELEKRAPWVPPHLPSNKPLRILTVGDYPPIPDVGTQVKVSSEVGPININQIEQLDNLVRVHYSIGTVPETYTEQFEPHLIPQADISANSKTNSEISNENILSKTITNLQNFQTALLELQQQILQKIGFSDSKELESLKVTYFGAHGEATLLIKKLKDLPQEDRKSAGMLVNEFKKSIDQAFDESLSKNKNESEWLDTSLSGIRPPQGHLHIVTQAIDEITHIFEKIGFTRVRHREVDWDYYAFEALNMPANHPARDEWETFFVENSSTSPSFSKRGSGGVNSSAVENNPTQPPLWKRGGDIGLKIVLTPHTSNGQVREMEKGNLPIRMINIAKCYRRQSDISHTPMFHQFEGLYVDKNVSIGHLSGVFDFFVKQFYGPNRKIRLRPFHFQFTEPSFEVDINCAICLGTGLIKKPGVSFGNAKFETFPQGGGGTEKCRLCKSGWLEIGGAGMVHPNVLKYGGIDPNKYSGFAFGWGVERVYMMKSGTQLDDIRLLYGNDIRFLEQF